MRGFSEFVLARRFPALLGLAVAAMLVQPLGGDSSVWAHVAILLYAAVFAGTAALARPVSRRTPAALALVTLWLALAVLHENIPGSAALRVVGFAVTLALVVMVAWLAFEALARDTTEGSDALAGAILGYLLLALVWAQVYRAIEAMNPGAISLPGEGGAEAEMLYFSLVTITTLGYGDVLPVSPFARILAGAEAAFGTLYIAVLIGRIVGVLTPPAPGRDRGAGEAAGAEGSPRRRRRRRRRRSEEP